MGDTNRLYISSASEMWEPRNRRVFLKLMAVGGSAVFLPSILSSCDSLSNTVAPGSGTGITIDFSNGDVAVLQFAYALEQLEADFYTRVVASFSGSNLSVAEQTMLNDIKNHEVVHRDFLKLALGANANFTLTTTYPGVTFTDRTSVLTTAQTFEFLGVAAYNGAGQYISNAAYLTLAGKIVSVEARHASAIADALAPKTSAFAPRTFENADKPSDVGIAAQTYIVQHLTLAHAPASFSPSPSNS
jgi:hypothetical protein